VITLKVLRDGEELDIPVTLGERPSAGPATVPVSPESDGINAREAIQIATRAAEDEELLTGEITERIATPDEVEGLAVWVVELVTENETVVVTVDEATGEVISVEAE
jgi:hypothetical protein